LTVNQEKWNREKSEQLNFTWPIGKDKTKNLSTKFPETQSKTYKLFATNVDGKLTEAG